MMRLACRWTPAGIGTRGIPQTYLPSEIRFRFCEIRPVSPRALVDAIEKARLAGISVPFD